MCIIDVLCIHKSVVIKTVSYEVNLFSFFSFLCISGETGKYTDDCLNIYVPTILHTQ